MNWQDLLKLSMCIIYDQQLHSWVSRCGHWTAAPEAWKQAKTGIS